MTKQQIIDDFNKRIEDVVKARNVQCADGNWNYAPYMHGLANGLALAVSILTKTEPVFKDAPTVWLADIPADPAAKPVVAPYSKGE
jgi:hypothetical protein